MPEHSKYIFSAGKLPATQRQVWEGFTATAKLMVDFKHELALQLGLKPYAEFERFMASCLTRLTPEDRKEVLEKVYTLVVDKVIRESDKKELALRKHVFREQKKSIRLTRTHIGRAIKELLGAERSFHPDLPKWFDVKPIVLKLQQFDRELLDNEELLGRLAGVLEDPTGRTITHYDSIALQLQTFFGVNWPPRSSNEDSYVFPGRKATKIDYPFISVVNECLPKAQAGKRSRFGRDKFIQMLFEFLDERCSRSRITQARRRISKRAADNKDKNA